MKQKISTMKELKMQKRGSSDEYYTTKEALYPLLPYLKKEWIILENAWGMGHLASYLQQEGFRVVSNGNKFDCIVTNPPYSKKDKWLENCYLSGKPFALLLPLSALGGKKRNELYRKNGIELIIPNRRIDFITPNGKGSGVWFHVAWFCWKLNLPKQLNFVELPQKGG